MPLRKGQILKLEKRSRNETYQGGKDLLRRVGRRKTRIQGVWEHLWPGSRGMAGHRGTYTCNPSTWEVGTQRSGVQDQVQLYSESEVNLSYVGPCLKNRGMEEEREGRTGQDRIRQDRRAVWGEEGGIRRGHGRWGRTKDKREWTRTKDNDRGYENTIVKPTTL